MRFNFLADAPPQLIARLRAMRIPSRLHAPLLALCTAVILLIAITGILTYRLGAAHATQRLAQVRLNASKALLQRDHIARAHYKNWLNLDNRVRAIRLSGWSLARRFAAIANHLPRRAWLTSITDASSGIAIDGRAEGMTGLAQTVTGLLASRSLRSPRLVRATALNGRAPGLLSFELRVKSHR